MPPKRFGPGGVPAVLPDQVTPRKGADLAPVRADREAGHFVPVGKPTTPSPADTERKEQTPSAWAILRPP